MLEKSKYHFLVAVVYTYYILLIIIIVYLYLLYTTYIYNCCFFGIECDVAYVFHLVL